jgi:hypothetical protein
VELVHLKNSQFSHNSPLSNSKLKLLGFSENYYAVDSTQIQVDQDGNPLTGSIPSEIWTLTTLLYLDLDSITLTRSISESLCNYGLSAGVDEENVMLSCCD